MLLLPVCLACLGLTPLTAAAENGASPENSAGAPGAESAAEHPGNAKSGATSDTSGADANPQGGPKVLVIYYSYSGNTKIVAERLREKTGGDIYAVETERAYPEAYRDVTAEAKRELETRDLPALKGAPPDLAPYNLILVGGPVWWYTVPAPLMKFLEQTDFMGKRVAAFCTHGGGPGDYLDDFKTQAKNAVVLSGITLWGAQAGNRKTGSILNDWLTKLERE